MKLQIMTLLTALYPDTAEFAQIFNPLGESPFRNQDLRACTLVELVDRMSLMTSRHAVHRLSSFDVTSCATSYLQLVLVAKEMGWLLPRILTFLTSSPAVAACLIGTEHPLF